MESFGLRHSRDPRPDAVPAMRIVDQHREDTAIGKHIRTGSDEAHRSQQYIEELRHLIEMRTPQPRAAARDASSGHTSQLVAVERAAPSAYSFLHEKNRCAGVDPDYQGKHGQQPRQHKKDNQDRYCYV
jgi:hypothetical protein